MSLSLQGCILAGLGVLGGGGYYVGTKAGKREDERIKTQALVDVKQELEQKQQVEAQADQNIATQISQNYVAGALTNQIAVYPEVRNGVVILHGRVPDAQTAERAINAARKTPGVQRIISNLVIMNQQPQAIPLTAVPEFQKNIQQQNGQIQQQYIQQQQMNNMQPVQGYPQMQYQQQPEPQQIVPIPAVKQNQSEDKTSMKKSQVANKQQPKQQKTSPPEQSATYQTSTEYQSPKLLPENKINYYSDDNDSGYKEYRPRQIKKAPKQVKQENEQQPTVIYVPVPVPSYESDNDAMYRNVGEYNPNPLAKPTKSSSPTINNNQSTVPLPSDSEDNDFQYYTY